MERRLRKSKLMLEVERRHGRPLEVLLRELHVQTGNYVRVAEALGVQPATVYYWFRKFDIPLSRFVVPALPEKDSVPA